MAAVTEISQKIQNIGLVPYPDKKINSLLDAGSSQFDQHFIVMTGLPEPWPEVAQTPTAWITDLRIEIGAVVRSDFQLTVDVLTDTIKNVIVELRYREKQHSTLWSFSPPTIMRLTSNPSMLIGQITARLRFTS